MKILIAGAGAMGCEILKQLKMFNYDITIVDFDLVEPTNLTTSLFYTSKDISLPKTLALKKLGYNVINSKIQSISLMNYDVIISALDNLESRMDLNLLFMESNTKYLIDVGVNGLKGHIKVVNKNNSCLFCIKHIYDKEDNSCGSKRDDVIPTVVYFNAIMAGCIGKVLVNVDEIDFLFVNCEDMNYFERIYFEKCDSCIVCNKNTF